MDSDRYMVEGHPNLVKDKKSGAVINTNRDAYAAAKKRAASAQAQRDEIRNRSKGDDQHHPCHEGPAHFLFLCRRDQ